MVDTLHTCIDSDGEDAGVGLVTRVVGEDVGHCGNADGEGITGRCSPGHQVGHSRDIRSRGFGEEDGYACGSKLHGTRDTVCTDN